MCNILEAHLQRQHVSTLQWIGWCRGSTCLRITPDIRSEGKEVVTAECQLQLVHTHALHERSVEIVGNLQGLQAQILRILLIEGRSGIIVFPGIQ